MDYYDDDDLLMEVTNDPSWAVACLRASDLEIKELNQEIKKLKKENEDHRKDKIWLAERFSDIAARRR